VRPFISTTPPIGKLCGCEVSTTITSVPEEIFTEEITIEFSVNGEEYEVGTLLINLTVSHFVGWGPYSKSVSIRVSGLLTLNLLTGSLYVLVGFISSSSYS
jgi:hypothetical protein